MVKTRFGVWLRLLGTVLLKIETAEFKYKFLLNYFVMWKVFSLHKLLYKGYKFF